jgi:hypothetical protein
MLSNSFADGSLSRVYALGLARWTKSGHKSLISGTLLHRCHLSDGIAASQDTPMLAIRLLIAVGEAGA